MLERILASLMTGALCAGAVADELVWSTTQGIDLGWGGFLGHSVYTPGGQDTELADDFHLVGEVTRVFWDGHTGAFDDPTVYGAFIRFYDWVDGEVGELQAEHWLEAGDPGLVYDPENPGDIEIVLPVPFQADGWHWVSIQMHNSASYWALRASNTGPPEGSAVRWRDNAKGPEWGPYKGDFGNLPVHDMDIVAEIYGTYAGAPPVIDSISAPSIDRSGRIVVEGAGFGVTADTGQLLVDGVPALVTWWSASRVRGYVPEAASLGEVEVRVQSAQGLSEPAMLEVTPRTLNDNVRWRFAPDSDRVAHRVGVGPQGNVYILDQDGRLYALTSDGGLMWIADALRGQIGNADDGPVVVGDDGTIYAPVNPLGPTVEVVAFNPDGSLKWVHTDPFAETVGVGPGVGPDGNVYFVTHDDLGAAQGVVSLTPEGDVRWMNPGSPFVVENAPQGADMAFAPVEMGAEPAQVVFTFDRNNDRRVYAFDMADGDQRFAVTAGVVEVFVQPQLQVAVGGDGRLLMAEFTGLGGLGWALQAFDPSDGNRDWRFDPGINSGVTRPFVGMDGSIYVGWDLSRISKLTPGGQEIWRIHTTDNFLSATPSPAGDLLIAPGKPDFGVSGFIKAFDIETSDEVFHIALPDENGGYLIPNVHAIFTPAGDTAYVPATIPNDPVGGTYCFVYAVATGEAGCAADVNGDGALNILDFVAFQNLFKAGDPGADCTGDGALNILDFVCYQAVFIAGCA